VGGADNQPAQPENKPAQRREARSPAAAPIQRDLWDNVAAAQEQAATNQQNGRPLAGGIVAPHPVQIGARQDPLNANQTDGQDRHFDPEMLAALQTLLDGLPPSHVIGNPRLVNVVMQHGNGISSYGNGQLSIVVPGDVDSWIYLSVSKWPLGDLATTLLTNQSYAGNAGGGRPGPKYGEVASRDVVGTGTIANKLSMIGDNFVEWMLKHETGHSVDEAIGWTNGRHYRDPHCGGWIIHDGTDAPLAGLDQLVLGALLNAGEQNALDLAFNNATGNPYRSLRAAIQQRDPGQLDGPPNRGAALAAVDGTHPGTRARVLHAERIIREGLDSPWQKGGSGGIPLGNRTYHVEYQHNRWVSYESAKYPLRNSNYQYSGPDEWFAESYAAYFKHSPWKVWRQAHDQWGEHLNDAQINQWFLNQLDPINGGGALIVNEVLQPIGGPAPMLPVQNPAVAPTNAQRIAELLENLFITVVRLPLDGLFRILSTVFGVAGGLLKYLLYVPARMLYRAIAGLF
jgi:hypothetical protein